MYMYMYMWMRPSWVLSVHADPGGTRTRSGREGGDKDNPLSSSTW